MDEDNGIKRFEPLGFLLALGILVMSILLSFALFRYKRLVDAAVVTPPMIGSSTWVGLAVLVLSFISLCLAFYFFKKMNFSKFTSLFGISLLLGLLFFGIQMANLPLGIAANDSLVLGFYYYAYMVGLHLLLVLIGLVAQGVLLARALQKTSYVESFIYSVNPPNILNIKLYLAYWGYLTLVWACIVIFMQFYAL